MSKNVTAKKVSVRSVFFLLALLLGVQATHSAPLTLGAGHSLQAAEDEPTRPIGG